MTDTLTENFKPIRLPRINANLLSVVALILICAMSFLIVSPAIAGWCLKEHAALAITGAALFLANAVLDAAVDWLLTCDADEIFLAVLAVGAAQWAVNEAKAADDAAIDDLDECQNPDSGSCSGSCG